MVSSGILSQMHEFRKVQTNMNLKTLTDKYILEGIYSYNLIWNDISRIGNRYISIHVPINYPEMIPQLYIKEIPAGVSHIYEDNSVCLATIGELIAFLAERPTFNDFASKFIDSFLYTLNWYEQYGTYPFGEREHGWKGLKSFYLEDWNLTEQQYMWLVSAVVNGKFRGHNICFCGSGLKLRNCHGKKLVPILKNERSKDMFIKEAIYIWKGEQDERK